MTPELEHTLEKIKKLSIEKQKYFAFLIDKMIEEKVSEKQASTYTQEQQMKIETGMYQARRGDFVQEEPWQKFMDKCTGVL